MRRRLALAWSWRSHSSSVLHFDVAAGLSRRACSHSSAVRDPNRRVDLVEHPIAPRPIPEIGERGGVGEVEVTAAVQPEEVAQLAPPLGAAHVDLHRPTVPGLVDVEHRGVGADHRVTPSGTVEDGAAVEEQEGVEQRRLHVLAVAGGLALHQRGADAQHGEQGRTDARHREGEPDRVVAGEQPLLGPRSGVHQRLPAGVVAATGPCCRRRRWSTSPASADAPAARRATGRVGPSRPGAGFR